MNLLSILEAESYSEVMLSGKTIISSPQAHVPIREASKQGNECFINTIEHIIPTMFHKHCSGTWDTFVSNIISIVMKVTFQKDIYAIRVSKHKCCHFGFRIIF